MLTESTIHVVTPSLSKWGYRRTMKKYFVYILLCSDNSYYVGVTNDVVLRVQEHNKGLDTKSYTIGRRPVKLVWYQEFLDRNEAISKEKQLKGWSRKKKEALIAGDYGKLPELTKNAGKKPFDRLSVTNDFLKKLPYTKPFLFVDGLTHIDANGVVGYCTFREDSDFYKGHFKDNPVTPGVILTECCAQIGLVCLGLYVLDDDDFSGLKIGMSSSEMEFYIPVYPNEKVTVTSEKVYFRFNKLKCKVKMHNSKGELVCRGTLAGMLKSEDNG